MFEVKGIPIFVDEEEVLKEVRRQVLEQQGRNILAKIKRSGQNIMICCPNHKDGQERNPSCGVLLVRNKDKPPGTVHCLACGYTDSLDGMISKCFGYDDPSFGTNWLMENFIGDSEIGRPDLFLDFNRTSDQHKSVTYVTEEELAKYRFYHPYMYKRKLTNEVIEKYDVGYQPDFIFSEGWQPTPVITFPVRDIDGNCLFVSRRSIVGKNFFLPKDIDKPVYGIYELPKDCSEVIICESVINALTCVSYGKPAVALFGTGDQLQYNVLNSLPVRKYILGLDSDSAGMKGTYKLKKALKNKLLTKLVLPPNKDINDLTELEFKSLPEVFV